MKIKNIFTGFWNWVFPNPQIEEMAQRRLRHCNGYSYKDRGNTTVINPRCTHNIKGTCDLCGCVLKAKTRVADEYCLILKWGIEEIKK